MFPSLIHDVSTYMQPYLLFICLFIPVPIPLHLNEFSLQHISPNRLHSFLIDHVYCLVSVSTLYSLTPPACHLCGAETSCLSLTIVSQLLELFLELSRSSTNVC